MKKVILMGVPHHRNLGDNAIAIAEKKYLQDNFKEYEYYEVPEETIEKCVDKVKEYINDDDLIFFHGGGNLGDEYLYVERSRRKVIQNFKNNVIVLFPETMYFKDNEKGKEELEKSKKIYSEHSKLLIIAREEVSFNIMKKEFPKNEVVLTHDIVTYLNKTKESEKRDGLLFVLRNDREANRTEDQQKEMDRISKKYFTNIEYSDTVSEKRMHEKERENRIEELLEKYRKTKLVITDRLHGMIFAAITSTPCIAIGNYNHKVKASAETLKDFDYIKFIDSTDELEEKIKYLINGKFESYNNDFAYEEFKIIKEFINSHI